MDLNEYQNLARHTAIYPGQGTITGLTYTILGLVGEAGELSQTPTAKEKGDNFWFLAQACYELELPLSYINKPTKLEGTYFETVALMAGQFSKVYRDNNLVLTPAKRQELISFLTKIYNFLDNMPGSNSEALKANIEKLFGRKERGTLTGDGEDR